MWNLSSWKRPGFQVLSWLLCIVCIAFVWYTGWALFLLVVHNPPWAGNIIQRHCMTVETESLNVIQCYWIPTVFCTWDHWSRWNLDLTWQRISNKEDNGNGLLISHSNIWSTKMIAHALGDHHVVNLGRPNSCRLAQQHVIGIRYITHIRLSNYINCNHYILVSKWTHFEVSMPHVG